MVLEILLDLYVVCKQKPHKILQQSSNYKCIDVIIVVSVINNNYAVANSGNGGEGSSDSSFPSTFTAFTVPYSLASK